MSSRAVVIVVSRGVSRRQRSPGAGSIAPFGRHAYAAGRQSWAHRAPRSLACGGSYHRYFEHLLARTEGRRNVASKTLIFVYGSLRRGEQHHGLMEGAEFVGERRTRASYRVVTYVEGYSALV